MLNQSTKEVPPPAPLLTPGFGLVFFPKVTTVKKKKPKEAESCPFEKTQPGVLITELKKTHLFPHAGIIGCGLAAQSPAAGNCHTPRSITEAGLFGRCGGWPMEEKRV